MANIILATSLLWPEPESDAPLREAIANRGHTYASVPWNNDDQSPFHSADLVILRSCWDYYKQPSAFLSWLDSLEQHNVPIRNRLPLVRWNFDKSYLIELKDAGFNVPETILVNPNDHGEIQLLMRERSWQKAVRKPVSGQSGQFVDILELDHYESWPSSEMPTEQALLQPFQEDVTTQGETLLFFFHGTFSYAIQRLPKPLEGRSRIQVSVSNKVVEQAQAILDHLDQVPLYARIDGLIRDDRFLLMELELIEPSFAFETAPDKATDYVIAIETEMS